jgi:hydrocephalus-inducing protein
MFHSLKEFYNLGETLLKPVGLKPEDTNNSSVTAAAKNGVGDVEKNPVFDSIARYLGIDLTAEGRAARNRRGVAMVVHGPPLSGKSRAAVALAKFYECALITLDSIVIEAIATSTSQAAAKARQICAEAAFKHAEEVRAQEIIEASRLNLVTGGAQSTLGNSQANTGGLSVEALAQHTTTRNKRKQSEINKK